MATRRDPQMERKLRPLYDALDNLNNKQAIQRADKILKKEKDFHCAKVLKALALVRLMKSHEATAILDEVKCHFPLDECTLQAMSVCYKELLIPQHIPILYETALQYKPSNEDYMTQLFMAYVRIKDYKKQQQVASKLHKTTTTAAYSYWNAMSLVLMGRDNPDLGKVMCFPLALKIIEKSKEKCEEIPEEVFRLYLDVLEHMNMHDKAILELDNVVKNVVIDNREWIRLKLRFQKILGNTKQCNILYKNALLNEPDCYEFYKNYFDTAFELLTDTTTPHDPELQIDPSSPDTSINEMTALLLKVSENAAIRGPDLAKADLVVRLKERGIEMCSFACPSLLILQYVQRFGHKFSCYSDLTIVIDRLSPSEAAELVGILEKYRCTVKESNGTKAMQRLATLHLLLRHLGKYQDLDVDQLYVSHQEIWNFHQITLEDDLGCTYIDTFTLLYAWHKADTGIKGDIIDAIKCLSSKLEQYPEASACRVLITRLYEYLGAVGPAVEMFVGLDTKSLQLDSLAHILYPSLIPLGAYHRADKQARQMEAFYRTSEREVMEYVVKSYLCGKFHKVTELFELHHCLVNSISRSISTLDKLWLSLFLSSAASWDNVECLLPGVEEELTTVKTHNLIDNRDYNVNEICDRRHKEIAEIQSSTSYAHDTIYVLLRHFMLTSILELHQYSNNKEKCRVEEILAEFREGVVEKVGDLVDTKEYPLYAIMSQSMSTWCHFNTVLQTVVSQSYTLIKHVVHNVTTTELSLRDVTDTFGGCLVTCREKLLVEETVDSSNLPYLSCLVQVLSFTVFCLSCGISSRVPRKRKVLADSVVTCLKTMLSDTSEFTNTCVAIAVNHKLHKLTLVKDDSVDSRIGSSVEWSLDEISTILNTLTILVNSLQNRGQQKS